MTDPLPIARLIHDQLRVLGIDFLTLGRRIGYRNPLKAAGRIDAICQGFITSKKSRTAISRLPAALGVPVEAVERAVDDTMAVLAERLQQAEIERQAALAAEEASWRASFKPHAIIQTEHTMPTQISLCGFTGGERRWLQIDLDASQPPITFVPQTLAKLPKKLHYNNSGQPIIPFFGRALGFFVNYTPDHAVLFDLDGNPREVLTKAYRCCHIWVSIGNKVLPPSMLFGAAD